MAAGLTRAHSTIARSRAIQPLMAVEYIRHRLRTARSAANTSGNGGGSAQGTLNNCLLTGNSATNGGGAYFGTVHRLHGDGNTRRTGAGLSRHSDSFHTGHQLGIHGGGANQGLLYYCTLTGNSSTNAGGALSAGAERCLLVGNPRRRMPAAGGVYSGTLTNCT